jgi:TolB-like protein/class 3 adenylate cyclase
MHTVIMERRLAAILSADVQGYSRLMGDDEEVTIRTLTAYRDLMTRLIQQYHGRVVDAPGDNVLAEFASVVESVQCAVAIQQALTVRNAELPSNRAMPFRIGINLGDVIVEGERIYGDGVNIAARLESLAAGGGICIAGTVFDQVESKLDLAYIYMGEQIVKNIIKPVRIYQVQMKSATSALMVPARPRMGGRQDLRTTPIALGILMILAGMIALWYGILCFAPHAAAVVAVGQPESLLPAHASIVVLPFVSLGHDGAQESLSGGMTEALITELSRLTGLCVVDSQARIDVRGKSALAQRIGQQVGVQYVLLGSVHRADTRVRITAQLVNTSTGQYLWANRYDRELRDMFALQDEVTQRIVTALRGTVFHAAQLQNREGR